MRYTFYDLHKYYWISFDKYNSQWASIVLGNGLGLKL